MGSATIKSNLGAGQYTVELTKSQAAITTQKTSLTTRKTEIDAAIAAKEIELTALNVIQNAKYEDWKAAVGAYAVADPPTKALRKAVTDAQKAYITAQSNVTKKQTEINLLNLELVSVNKRLTEIETALTVEERTVWCVDYSDALTGSVGTIEINGEADAINIMPGGATGAGLLQHPLAMTPSGVFVNSAKLPAWQKWMPTYRAGVITSIDEDVCNVTLDEALSSAQSIDINQKSELTNVPIEYMNTDGMYFQVADHVVVQFVGQDQANPKVIGYVTNPRGGSFYVLKYISWEYPTYPLAYYEVTIPLGSLEIRTNKGLKKLVNTTTGEIYYCKEYIYRGNGRFCAMFWFRNPFEVAIGMNDRPDDFLRTLDVPFTESGGQVTVRINNEIIKQIGTDRIWIYAQPRLHISAEGPILVPSASCSDILGYTDYNKFAESNKVAPGIYNLIERNHLYYPSYDVQDEENYEFYEVTAAYCLEEMTNREFYKFIKALTNYENENLRNIHGAVWKKVYITENLVSGKTPCWKIGPDIEEGDIDQEVPEGSWRAYVPHSDILGFKSYYHSTAYGDFIGSYVFEVYDIEVHAIYWNPVDDSYYEDEVTITGVKYEGSNSYGWDYDFDVIPKELGSYILVGWYCNNNENRSDVVSVGGSFPNPQTNEELGNYNSLLPAEIDESPDWVPGSSSVSPSWW